MDSIFLFPLVGVDNNNFVVYAQHDTDATDDLFGSSLNELNTISKDNLDNLEELKSFGYGKPSDIVYSPDGDIIAVSSNFGVRLFDSQTLEETMFFGEDQIVWSMVWSPDGKFLFATINYYKLVIWDVQSGETVEIPGLSGERVEALAFSPDGKMLAIKMTNTGLFLWNVTIWKFEKAIQVPIEHVHGMAWSPDCRLLAIGHYGYVEVIDLISEKVIASYSGNRFHVKKLAWSPDGTLLASICDKKLVIWDMLYLGKSAVLENANSLYPSFIWLKTDGNIIVNNGQEVVVRSPSDFKIIGKWEAEGNGLIKITSSPDGKWIASVSNDYAVTVFDSKSGEIVRSIILGVPAIYDMAWSPDETMFATASYMEHIHIWDARTGKVMRRLDGLPSRVLEISWSPDSKLIAANGYQGIIIVWDVANGEPLIKFEGHEEWTGGLAFSPDGKTLASVSYDRTIRFWDIQTMSQSRLIEVPGSSLTDIAWSPDGRFVATGRDNGRIDIWNVKTGKPRISLIGHEFPVIDILWIEGGANLVSITLDEAIIWDLKYGLKVKLLDMENRKEPFGFHWARSMAWCPENGLLAIGTMQNTVTIWDLETSTILKTIEGAQDLIHDVQWLATCKILAVTSADGSVRLFGCPN